jgi:hypothetical protein
MNKELEELLEDIKAYRNDMVARNYPYQRISDIITRWEMKKITEQVSRRGMKDFLEEAEKEKKELAECYKEAKRQTEERRSTEWSKGYNKWKENK